MKGVREGWCEMRSVIILIESSSAPVVRGNLHNTSGKKKIIRRAITKKIEEVSRRKGPSRVGAQEDLRATCGHLRTLVACKLRTGKKNLRSLACGQIQLRADV